MRKYFSFLVSFHSDVFIKELFISISCFGSAQLYSIYSILVMHCVLAVFIDVAILLWSELYAMYLSDVKTILGNHYRQNNIQKIIKAQ